MNSLAFDTTTDICSLALADENGLLGEYDFAHRMDLSRRLVPNIKSLMADCGLEMKDLGAIGVSIGPGSFTGLRIGVSTAKTLAQVLGVPAVGLVSLDLLARQFDYLPGFNVCPIIKVRKGEAYYAFYRSHLGGLERLTEYVAGTLEELMERARNVEGGDVIFCGDALPANLPALRAGLGDRMVAAPPQYNYPKAGILARITLERVQAGEVFDPLALLPFYIRKSTPEMRLECPRSTSV